MQAIILAAGMGRRLKDLTVDNTKCMVKVNGVTLIERVLHQLEQLNLNRVIIVVGYHAEKLKSFIKSLSVNLDIIFVTNSIYDKTNNIYSLALAKDFLIEDDTLLMESDLIFEDSVLQTLLDDPRDTLALVDKYESWMDGTCVKLGDDDVIDSFVPKSKFVFEEIQSYYKTVNIYKFSQQFSENYYVPFLTAYSTALGNNEYYEQVLRVITLLDDPVIKAKKLNGQLWYEIDDIQDLDIASSMFTNDENVMLSSIQSRYGGYWRYPKLLDFCYLVNPYFPPQKLTDEIKANFETLLTQYPSGMQVNSLLAAKNFGIHQEHILVGNGAAELIKSLMNILRGPTGIIRPTFEEYPNRCIKEDCVIFEPQSKDLSYTVDDLITYYKNSGIKNLVLINPDNPTGNYIQYEQLLLLIDWCSTHNICIIVDESFVDFASEDDNSLIKENILNQFKNLVVVKSISKSYGVPGLRLGILASSDEELISQLKNDVSIWNINSFAEFYMQIEEKYKKDYDKSLELLKSERERFIKELININGLIVYPSQANYIMIELTGNISSRQLTKRLLIDYNILIKDLTDKIKNNNRQFIRISIRKSEENDKLVNAIREIFLDGGGE